jgi:hypothetical protein
MSAYRLTRDDGVGLQVNGNAWETALELAYLYGWKPAGTDAPEAGSWLDQRTSTEALSWDRQDYFSHQSQRVGREDARALAGGVSRALADIADKASRLAVGREVFLEVIPAGCLPSRASALADGLSVTRRNTMSRLVAFASSGGFTIDGAP